MEGIGIPLRGICIHPYPSLTPGFRLRRHPCPPAAGLCKIRNGIPGLRPSGAFSLNGPYESKLSTARPTKKHRSFAAMPFRFAVSEGFEPPVRSHVHLFSRQAPSTTRTTHLWGCKDTILFSISNPSGDLLEPLGEMILGVEVVDG